MCAVDLDLEQIRQWLNHDVERSGQKQHAMPGTLVLANAPHALRVDAAQRHCVEGFASQTFHYLVIEALVFAVESALKVGARATLKVEPSRRLSKHLGHERRPIFEGLRPKSHP